MWDLNRNSFIVWYVSCWKGLGAGGEGDDRGWDGWMASLTRWTWVWVNSRSWWWTGRPGVLRFMGSQRVGHYWATELNWTDVSCCCSVAQSCSILWPHGLQHIRLRCPSLSPRAWSNSCPLSQWCHTAISSSVVPFSSCLQSFPASGSFQWISSSHQMAKVLELQHQHQHQSFQWIFRTDFL